MEIFKDIPNYEGLYQVSNLGRVKSLERKVKNYPSGYRTQKERILKGRNNGENYLKVALFKNSKRKDISIHQLMAITFLKHKPNGNKFVIDHIDNNTLNNRLDNIRIVTQRHNIIKGIKQRKTSSKYTGVCFDNTNKKWLSYIKIKGKQISLGGYKTEIQAYQAYEKARKTLTNYAKI